MSIIKLEYRIASEHTGKGKITSPNIAIQKINPFWSYVRHLSQDWDLTKSFQRTEVVWKLISALNQSKDYDTIDLKPLKNDQRVSGFVYGQNPLQNMYNITEELAYTYPEYEFFGKWGGYKSEKSGKRFVFYIDNESDADILIPRLDKIAERQNVPITAAHQYGIYTYRNFVKINSELTSRIKNRNEFKKTLLEIKDHPHFFHELFTEDCVAQSYEE